MLDSFRFQQTLHYFTGAVFLIKGIEILLCMCWRLLVG